MQLPHNFLKEVRITNRIKELRKSFNLSQEKLAEEFEKPLIINDHLDIAQIVDAEGIHTGQDDISIADIRKLWSPDKIY